MEINDKGACISARTMTGIFYGCQTLEQLMEDSRHAQDEDWYGQRRWSRTKRMETQTCLANVARQLNRAAASAAERMDMGEADVREIKELAGLLQALVGLGKSLEPPKPPEKKSGGTVRVVLSGEAEELSQ